MPGWSAPAARDTTDTLTQSQRLSPERGYHQDFPDVEWEWPTCDKCGSPTSWSVQMCGWLSAARVFASRSKRARLSGSALTSGGRTLIGPGIHLIYSPADHENREWPYISEHIRKTSACRAALFRPEPAVPALAGIWQYVGRPSKTEHSSARQAVCHHWLARAAPCEALRRRSGVE
jgi:hypothetical protein